MTGILDRLYERWGVGYLVLSLGCLYAISVVSTALNVAILQLYADLSSGDFLRMVGISQAMNALGFIVGSAPFLRRVWDLVAWTRSGGSPETSRKILELVNDLPAKGVPVVAVVIMLFEIPVAVYASGRLLPDSASISPTVAYVGVLEAVAAAALFVLLVFEQLLRPVARRAQRESLEAGLVPPPSALSLRRKLLVGLPIVCVMTAYLAMALANGIASTPGGRLTVGVTAALGVTLTVSLVLTATLSRSLTEPVRELIGSTERVERGDLSAFAHPLAGDELGVLAGRFNQMLLGLRERESLRETNVGLVNELQASRARIVASSDEARRKVERDLHDGAQQHLVLLDLKLAIAERTLEKGDPGAEEAVAEARADLERALAELRDLAHGIYPSVLESDGLPAALQEAAERAALPTTVASDGAGRYRPELEAAVYFCCLEALQNAGKYAGEGATASVRLTADDSKLDFEVRDDGVGFDPASAHGSAGLQNMADRIGALGGKLDLESAPGQGTAVVGSVPLSSSPGSGDA